MAKRKTDYIRQSSKNPKLFKFSIGSIGRTRDVFTKEFDSMIDAKLYMENYLDMMDKKMEENGRREKQW